MTERENGVLTVEITCPVRLVALWLTAGKGEVIWTATGPFVTLAPKLIQDDH